MQASRPQEPAELDVGVQLVVARSDADGFFGPFRDALIDSPALLAEYNELKQRLDGLDYERYTERKGEFVERVLRDLNAGPGSGKARPDRRAQGSIPETGRPSSR
ncbi:MAG: GrpB family protein [Solirubrobacteraceae bacterium]